MDTHRILFLKKANCEIFCIDSVLYPKICAKSEIREKHFTGFGGGNGHPWVKVMHSICLMTFWNVSHILYQGLGLTPIDHGNGGVTWLTSIGISLASVLREVSRGRFWHFLVLSASSVAGMRKRASPELTFRKFGMQMLCAEGGPGYVSNSTEGNNVFWQFGMSSHLQVQLHHIQMPLSVSYWTEFI